MDLMWVKLIGGAVLIGVVSFVYALITGKSISEARRDNQARRERSTPPK